MLVESALHLKGVAHNRAAMLQKVKVHRSPRPLHQLESDHLYRLDAGQNFDCAG